MSYYSTKEEGVKGQDQEETKVLEADGENNSHYGYYIWQHTKQSNLFGL